MVTNLRDKLSRFAIFYIPLCLLAAVAGAASADDGPVVTVEVEGEFADVLDGVKTAVVGRGINIAHTLPAGEMLARTGPAFGVTESIYRSAETVEFCSAQVSHRLATANPENLVLCPFAISVYVLAADPDRVRLTYRRPFVLDEQSRPAVEAMMTLVEGIVAEATAW